MCGIFLKTVVHKYQIYTKSKPFFIVYFHLNFLRGASTIAYLCIILKMNINNINCWFDVRTFIIYSRTSKLKKNVYSTA